MEIIFAKTRWNYDSYVDFWRLVELSNFHVCYVDEMDVHNPANTYIVSPMNGEVLEFMTEARRNDKLAKICMWNLERPGGSGGIENYVSSNQKLIDQCYFDRIFLSDRALAKISGFEYLTLGGHEGLGYPDKAKFYDLIHLSCYSDHRAWLFDEPNQPKGQLFGLKVAPNGWGDFRHNNLRHTHIMLNVHQDVWSFIEPLRFILAAMYGMPLVSEYCTDKYPYDYSYSTFTDLRLLPGILGGILDNYEQWAAASLDFRYQMTTKWSFRQCVEEACG